MSSSELRRWNRLANRMEAFHNHFKYEYNMIYDLADGSFNERGMSLQSYLRSALELRNHLHMHHTIEEKFVFPMLAKRMSMFGNDEQHMKSHQGIHDGLDRLTNVISQFREEPSSYSPTKMREAMDSFREVLFRHLDEEVNDLRKESMEKYWTLEEVDKLQM